MTEDTNQDKFYALLDLYNEGTEPLESWTTEDIELLIAICEVELYGRRETDSAYDPVDDPEPQLQLFDGASEGWLDRDY